jgi:hypothetical protein
MPVQFIARAILNSFVSEYNHHEGFKSIGLILPGELAKHAISKGTKSVTNPHPAYKNIGVMPESSHAGPIQRVHGFSTWLG